MKIWNEMFLQLSSFWIFDKVYSVRFRWPSKHKTGYISHVGSVLYNLRLSRILIVSNTDDDFLKTKKWIYICVCVKNDEGKGRNKQMTKTVLTSTNHMQSIILFVMKSCNFNWFEIVIKKIILFLKNIFYKIKLITTIQ